MEIFKPRAKISPSSFKFFPPAFHSKEKLTQKAEGGQYEQRRDTNADSGEASPLGTFRKDGVHAGFFRNSLEQVQKKPFMERGEQTWRKKMLSLF